jgi:hypothetical protein
MRLVLARRSTGGTDIPRAKLIRADCGHTCWIAPAGQKLLASDDTIETFCMQCAGRRMATDTERPIMMPAPGARDELASVLGEQTADEIVALLHEFNGGAR